VSEKRWKTACAVIRAALSNDDFERILRVSGHSGAAIADAYAIGQAEDIVALAMEAAPAITVESLRAALAEALGSWEFLLDDYVESPARRQGDRARISELRERFLNGRR
jgi:hypothetical protein